MYYRIPLPFSSTTCMNEECVGGNGTWMELQDCCSKNKPSMEPRWQLLENLVMTFHMIVLTVTSYFYRYTSCFNYCYSNSLHRCFEITTVTLNTLFSFSHSCIVILNTLFSLSHSCIVILHLIGKIHGQC